MSHTSTTYPDSIHALTPELRFPGFEGEWEEKRLGEIANNQTTKNRDNAIDFVLTNSAEYGIVSQRDFFDKDIANTQNTDNYYIVNLGDFVYNPRISNFAPYGPIKQNNLQQGIMSPLYTVFSIQEGELGYYKYYFESSHRHKYLHNNGNSGARADRFNISNRDFYGMKIFSPSLLEQQKIAEFLRIVDDKIAHLRSLRDHWSSYKTGITQRIFNQEIRFSAADGSAFPAWEEKTLGEIGETYNGLAGKTAEDFGNGYKFITYKQIYDDTIIRPETYNFVQISKGEKQNKVQFGDVFFTTSSETPREVGYSSVFLTEIKENIYLNSFSFGYRINNHSLLSPYFARRLFRSNNMRKKIFRLAQGSTRYNMSKKELMKLKISLPSLPEQQLIADFLSSLDDKISSLDHQLQSAQRWKEGLLQKIFI